MHNDGARKVARAVSGCGECEGVRLGGLCDEKVRVL
jgi:hypothetical protein